MNTSSRATANKGLIVVRLRFVVLLAGNLPGDADDDKERHVPIGNGRQWVGDKAGESFNRIRGSTGPRRFPEHTLCRRWGCDNVDSKLEVAYLFGRCRARLPQL